MKRLGGNDQSCAKAIKYFDQFAKLLSVPDLFLRFCAGINGNEEDLLAAGFILVSLEVIIDQVFQPADTANKTNRDCD
jgi:hypothetical protein